jgi:hypothetical protein
MNDGVRLLSHHRESEHERCIRVGRTEICRRCALLYPVAFATTTLSLAGAHWPGGQDRIWLFLLPLPMALEFILENIGGLAYRPLRQLLFTLVGAPALGRGFARYLQHPQDPLFWRMVMLFGGSCLLAFGVARRRPT